MRHSAAALLLAVPALSPAQGAIAQDFTSMDLEQLMAMEVTGVTKRAGTFARSPAAIYVLTGEDILRSGARTIADALRLVPGLQVVRTNAQSYAVTSRGFAGDKLQVLLDGRSVYTPLTSMVFWDVFDTSLEDISRIEVIRGPGATVWGANAVNGVINIVTKPAADSTDTAVHGGGGNEELAFGGFRSGGAIGDSAHGRAYARARERDSSRRADGSEAFDGQTQQQAGARIDANLGDLGTLAVLGDVYKARNYSATFPAGTMTETTASGRNVGAQWTFGWSGGASTQTAVYYDGYDRLIPTTFSESRDTYDVSVQQNFPALGDHLVTLGTGVRVTQDETGDAPQAVVVFRPRERTSRTYSAFLQDEWALSDTLWLIGGSKFQHNDFTGTEVQPGLRLGWAMAHDWFTWGAVSRAVRTPNRLDHDIGVFCLGADNPIAGCPEAGAVLAVGSRDMESEELIAYEWGLRGGFVEGLAADIALFYNDYEELRSSESGFRFANNLDAESYGGELSISWEATHWLGVHAFYNYLEIDARKADGSIDAAGVAALEGNAPEQQAGVRLAWQPWAFLDVDSFVRYVDNLPNQRVPHYTELDLRVAWHVSPFATIAVVGQNLLDSQHPEFGINPVTRSELERSVFARLHWRWQ